jgi:hypothetical protein
MIGAMVNFASNMLFSFNFITIVGPIDFGPTDELKRQSYSIFPSFQRLDPITRLFSIIFWLPGTARQCQYTRAVPRLGKMLWLRALLTVSDIVDFEVALS